MTHLTDVIEEEKKVLKAWNKDVFTDQEFADVLEEGMKKSALAVIDDVLVEIMSTNFLYGIEGKEKREATIDCYRKIRDHIKAHKDTLIINNK